jgi:hypothetical protein
MADRSEQSDALREALAQLAAAEAPELLAEARLGARARARSLLEDALVEELLQAAAKVRGEPSPRRVPPAAEQSTRSASGADPAPGGEPAWWAYCILAAADAEAAPVDLAGVDPAGAVEVVEAGKLAAVVSPVPLDEFSDEHLREHLNDVEWVERVARAHENVLERTLDKATILPLRLCTLYRDRDGIARMLRDQERGLRRALASLEGRREWGVKLFVDSDRLADAVGAEAEPPESGDQASGTAYLARRRRERELGERARELGDTVSQEVHSRLERVAADARVNPLQRPEVHGRDARMLLNGAYLVPREREHEFDDAVSSLREQWGDNGFTLELTGPWPPYNFVSTTAMVMP